MTGAYLPGNSTTVLREVAVPAPGPGQSAIGLDLCSMLADTWRGQPLEVHQAPTAVGRLSFALRWHGRRCCPALGLSRG